MSAVRLIEVAPRDGLQNEPTPVPTDVKRRFVAALAAAGLREIEISSFVSPKWVPQLADAAELFAQLAADPIPGSPVYWALVPNARGLARAFEANVTHLALFTAASDAFTQKNINQTVAESLTSFREIVAACRAQGSYRLRGYVSTAFECPYAGRITPDQVVPVVRALLEMGLDEISLGDTIGVAAPSEVRALTAALASEGIAPETYAYHFHDTRGTAIANVACALELGIRTFDASAGGLGGCPYAPGAGGNLATEDLVYFLERSGMPTGIDLDRLARASEEVLRALGRAPSAKAQRAVLGATCPTK